MMKTTFTTTLIILFVSCSYILIVRANVLGHNCPHCEEKVCKLPPDSCPYGSFTNICGFEECKRGPGESCGGGPLHTKGMCGDGMQCNNCNECEGCSLDTFRCFESSCELPKVFPFHFKYFE